MVAPKKKVFKHHANSGDKCGYHYICQELEVCLGPVSYRAQLHAKHNRNGKQQSLVYSGTQTSVSLDPTFTAEITHPQ